MKGVLLAVLLGSVSVGPTAHLCIGAQAAGPHAFLVAAQERSTPPGEWCQRLTRPMPAKAHACSCHKHDCTKDPSDPDNLSAHTDPMCLNYCTTTNCACPDMDCK